MLTFKTVIVLISTIIFFCVFCAAVKKNIRGWGFDKEMGLYNSQLCRLWVQDWVAASAWLWWETSWLQHSVAVGVTTGTCARSRVYMVRQETRGKVQAVPALSVTVSFKGNSPEPEKKKAISPFCGLPNNLRNVSISSRFQLLWKSLAGDQASSTQIPGEETQNHG